MPDDDLLRRYLDAGLAFTQMTRQKAEELVRDLARSGEVSREQTTAWVEDLLERSRQNTEALMALVRKELDDRIAQLNLVTRQDLANLASRLTGSGPSRSRRPAAKSTAKTTTKTAAKKAGSTAKKAGSTAKK